MRYILIIMTMILPIIPIYGQTMQKIQGRVSDANGMPLPYATVSLSSIKKVLLHGTVTDMEGRFELLNQNQKDSISLSFSYIGYETRDTTILINNQFTDIGNVILREAAIQLEDVAITANAISYNANSFTMNVVGRSITKGQNSFDLMSYLPGVTTFDGLKVNGQSAVDVYIDNRKVMDQSELLSLQAKDILKYEVIPVADVSYGVGVSSVIKITLKKIQDRGGYGSINNNFNIQSKGRLKESPSLTFNYRYGNWNFYNNYSFEYADVKSAYRQNIIYNNEADAEVVEGSYLNGQKNRRHSNIFNVVYDIDSLRSIAASFSIKSLPVKYGGNSVYSSNETMEYSGDGKSLNLGTGLNYIYWNPKTKVNHTTKLEFNHNTHNKNLTYYSVSDKVQEYLNDCFESDFKTGRISFDWSKDIGVHTLSAGISGSLTEDRNNTLYMSWADGIWVKDELQSLDMTRHGLGIYPYLNYRYQHEGWFLSAGVRYAYTKYKFDFQEKTELDFEREYKDFCPTVEGAYSFGNSNQHRVSLSYIYSMSYPNYGYFSPAVVRTSEFQYSTGNPWINNEYHSKLSFSLTLNKRWNFTYRWYHISDIIKPQLFASESDNRITYYKPMNNGDANIHTFILSTTQKPVDFWTTSVYVSAENERISSLNGYTQWHYYGYWINAFDYSETGNINVQLVAKSKFRSGNFTTKAYYTAYIGINQQLFKRRLTLSLGVYDVFNSGKDKKTSNMEDVYTSYTENIYDGRTYMFKLSYAFDLGKKKKVKSIGNNMIERKEFAL